MRTRISESTAELQEATNCGEYHALCLIRALANGRSAVADAGDPPLVVFSGRGQSVRKYHRPSIG